jgi:hypothetical protein
MKQNFFLKLKLCNLKKNKIIILKIKMSSLTEIFSKFFSRLKSSKQKKLETDCLLFTKLFNEQLLKDLQETIKVYAQNHIKNFDSDQDYQELKKKHNKNNLFVDKKFPTVDSTVFYTNEYKNWLIDQNCLSSQNHVIWRRAKNINKNAKMASTNYNTSDLNQGYVGDW